MTSSQYLHNIYNSIDVPSGLKINEFDIGELENINDKSELEEKVKNLQDKIQNL
ncbi:MAG: hypothetical protein LBF15_04295 [Candidatus Peribacteria bacterium]|jgi:hypothetical protein|nr:hypothetical protein [Candidatus Peribacteria bacterium]